MSDIDVYTYSITERGYPDTIKSLTYILDDVEKERYVRYKFDRDRFCFLYARFLLKKELATRLNITIESVRFSYTKNGKPYLTECELKFNLAHSKTAIVFAIADVELGIDIESLRYRSDLWEKPASFFHKNIAEKIENAVDDNERSRLFCRYWTSLEAVVKLQASSLFTHISSFGENGLTIKEDGYFKYNEFYLYTDAVLNDEGQMTLAFYQPAVVHLRDLSLAVHDTV